MAKRSSNFTRRKVQLTTRDTRIFAFLWKWKLATTRAIHMKFFQAACVETAYNRLNLLCQNGFIEIKYDECHMGSYWTLCKPGFLAIRHILPPLSSQGFKSESIGHDALVTAIHLGPALCQTPAAMSLVSEQPLRRYERESLPNWIPSSPLHRPDGYWKIRDSRGQYQVVALEVERSLKAKNLYERVAFFYSGGDMIDAVVWFLSSASDAKRLFQILKNFDTEAKNTHRFFTITEYAKHGWNCRESVCDRRPKKLSELLFCEQLAHEKAMKRSWTVMTQALLNARKS